MKHLGSISDWKAQRYRNIMREYRKYVQLVSVVNMEECFDYISRQTAERFYISEERAFVVISAILNGKQITTNPNRNAMFKEILVRVKKYMASNKGCGLKDAIFHVVNQPAPSFYITPGSIKMIFYDARLSMKNEKYRL